MTQKFLKEHEIIAVPFDKGIGICLMKVETYKSKLQDILNLDQFEKLKKPRKNAKNIVIKEQERINGELDSLVEEGEITEELCEKLKAKGAQPARLYGLGKVHKTIIPLRPVLSMPGSPYFNVAEKVSEWLSIIPESKNQCNSKKISDQLRDLKLEEDEILISFDVVSLYTNVPVAEAMQEAADRLCSGEFETPPISKETFMKLLKMSSTNVVMATHDGYYVQKDGLAMGSPPAPLLANIWLSKYEPQLRDNAKLFERYMDDVIRNIKVSHADLKLEEINQIHDNLRFTMEKEVDGKLPALDLLLQHAEDGTVTSTWYCKPTDTGLIMNFHALAPKRYKRSVVSGFVHRIFRACSTWENFHESIQRAKSILEKNQYPPQFYEGIIESTIQKLYNPEPEPTISTQQNQEVTTETENNKPSKFRICLQYRGSITDQFVKKMYDIQAPVQTVLTLRKLRSILPSLKCAIPLMIKSRVIYQITCPQCQLCYVGRTRRHLCTRFGEHKTKKQQPVNKHFMSCINRKPSEADIKILTTTSRGRLQLAILEALFIREIKPALNTRDEWRDHKLSIKV